MDEAGESTYIKETMNFMHRFRACGRFFVGLWNSSFALLDFMLQRVDLVDNLKEIEQRPLIFLSLSESLIKLCIYHPGTDNTRHVVSTWNYSLRNGVAIEHISRRFRSVSNESPG